MWIGQIPCHQVVPESNPMKRSGIILAFVLFLIPALLINYRVFSLGYPFLPLGLGRIWQVTMEVRVLPKDSRLELEIGLPSTDGERRVAQEKITSGSLDFNFFNEPPNRFGVWTGLVDPGDLRTISYRATILVRSQKAGETPPVLESYSSGFDGEEQALAERMVAGWRNLSPPARLGAIAGTVTGEWGANPLAEANLQNWSAVRKKYGPLVAFLALLRAADLPARPVDGLLLSTSVTENLLTWVEVWTGKKWEGVSPETGKLYKDSTRLLPLVKGGYPPLALTGGELSQVRWTVSRRIQDYWLLHFEHIRESPYFLDRWSLFQLPPDFQEAFRLLLLVPVCALIICLLRNVVGFPTFGIFMPVLMALAFRSTGLGYGLAIFTIIIAIGYLLRRWVDRLKLLLVPRLSMILTFVILILAFLALIGGKLQARGFMAVGLLPIVILTMSIERFFIIIEEAGVREALRTALGSAAVASIGYWVINIESLQLIFYFYPELLFGVAALQMLIGRYTGFRLLEIIRFREFRRGS